MKQHSSVEIVHWNILFHLFGALMKCYYTSWVFFRRSDLINLSELLKYGGDGGHMRVGSSISMKLVSS